MQLDLSYDCPKKPETYQFMYDFTTNSAYLQKTLELQP